MTAHWASNLATWHRESQDLDEQRILTLEELQRDVRELMPRLAKSASIAKRVQRHAKRDA